MVDHQSAANSSGAYQTRKVARYRCRETLAEHIFERTGITMLPKQVRLINTERDGYFWKVHSDDMRPLFVKGISGIGIRGHRRLIKEVGVGYEAIPFAYNSITYEPVPILAPRPLLTEEEQERSKQFASVCDVGASRTISTCSEVEVGTLKMKLQNANSQCELALHQLQECTSQLQVAIQAKEYYESFMLKMVISMDEVGRMMDGIRGESYKAFGSRGVAEAIHETPPSSAHSIVINK